VSGRVCALAAAAALLPQGFFRRAPAAALRCGARHAARIANLYSYPHSYGPPMHAL